ncbi:hypothetical protein DITRI_Ditri02bG0035700 [Diplodiscus trichospermus]
MAMNFSRLGFLFFLICIQLYALSFVQSTQRFQVCWSNSTFDNKLDHLFSTITKDTQIDNGFYNVSYGENLDQFNAIGLCALVDGNNATNGTEFSQVLATLLDGLITQAASGDSLRKFAKGNAAVSDSQTIYAVAQCTPDLSPGDCNDCLKNAKDSLSECCSGKLGARFLTPRCNIRYDNNKFHGPLDAIPPAPPAPVDDEPASPPDYAPVADAPVSPPVDSPVADAPVSPPVDATPPFITLPAVDAVPPSPVVTPAPPPQETEQPYIESGEGNKNSRFQLLATVIPLMILQYFVF